MTLEELIEKMLNFTDVGIRCSSLEERDELGDFLSAYVKGQRTWTDGARKDEMIVFWSDGEDTLVQIGGRYGIVLRFDSDGKYVDNE